MGERLTARDDLRIRGEVESSEMLTNSRARMLLAELDALRADLARATGERDEALAKIGDVRASISAHKVRVATDERDASDERAQVAEKERDDARAQLAALHAAFARWRDTPRRPECDLGTCGACGVCLYGDLRTALADTAAVAKAHDEATAARAASGVRAEATEDAAAYVETVSEDKVVASWLRQRAAAERGGR